MRKFSNPEIYSAIALLSLYGACSFMFFNHDMNLSELQKVFVPGVFGVQMLPTDSEDGLSFDPWEIQEKNIPLPRMLESLCVKANLSARCYQDSGVRFRTFMKEHVIDIGGQSFTLERNVTPVSVGGITPEFLDGRMSLIGQWAQHNQSSDGSLPYYYNPSSDTYASDNNAIRQLITIQGLFAIARDENDAITLDVAQRAEKKVLHDTYRSTSAGYAYIADYSGRVPLGATALAILMLREHGNNTPSAVEKNLAEYILRMQRPDGSFQTFLESATSTEDEQFYSGEALTAIARMNAIHADSRFEEVLSKGYDYYRAKLGKDFMPQYAPWHMQAYSIAYEKSHDERYAEYVFWLADGLIQTMLKHDVRARPDEVGRFFNPEYPQWGPPHSASTSIYVEGLTYAHMLAKERGESARAQKYKDAILQGTRSLLLLQWTPESAYYVAAPDRVVGSFKISITDNRGRIDQTGHTANAFARVKEILK